MSESTSLERICELLADPRRYGDLGRQAGDRLRRWLSGALPHAYPEIVARHLTEERLERIDLSLDEASLMLLDIIDLDRKLIFERQLVPRLRDGLERGDLADLPGLRDWPPNPLRIVRADLGDVFVAETNQGVPAQD